MMDPEKMGGKWEDANEARSAMARMDLALALAKYRTFISISKKELEESRLRILDWFDKQVWS